MGDQISINEASKMAGCSSSTIRRWLLNGELSGTKSDGVWAIDRSALAVHLHQLPKPFKGRQGASKESSTDRDTHHDTTHKELLDSLHREQKINDELRAENKKLQEEVKALLAGKSQGLLSRWRLF